MLLSDERVERLLTEKVVPCWESVGTPAKVTIELGDGSAIQRTLGGNTAMYLCDASGRVIDVYPGVYTADDWLGEVAQGLELLASGPVDDAVLASWHAERAAELTRRVPIGISKRVLESPILNVLGARPESDPSRAIGLEDVSKQPGSAQELRELYLDPTRRALSPRDFGLRIVIEDSRNNVTEVRPRTHALLAGLGRATPRELERRIFEELLGIDLGDPTLGLRDVLLPGTDR